jgi:hypothetical protein
MRDGWNPASETRPLFDENKGLSFIWWQRNRCQVNNAAGKFVLAARKNLFKVQSFVTSLNTEEGAQIT